MQDGKELPRWRQDDPAHKPLKQWDESPALKPRHIYDAYLCPDHKPLQVPLDPYVWFLKPSGNVVSLTVMTTRNLKEAQDPRRYETYIINVVLRKGFIPWQFEDVQRIAPWILQRESIGSNEEWRVWREKERQRRKEKYDEESEPFRRVWATQDPAQVLKSQETMAAAMVAITAELKKINDEKQQQPTRRSKKAGEEE